MAFGESVGRLFDSVGRRWRLAIGCVYINCTGRSAQRSAAGRNDTRELMCINCLFKFQGLHANVVAICRNIGCCRTSICCKDINSGMKRQKLWNYLGCEVYAKWTNSRHRCTWIAAIAAAVCRMQLVAIAANANRCRAPSAVCAIESSRDCMRGVRDVHMAAMCCTWKNGFRIIQSVRDAVICANTNKICCDHCAQTKNMRDSMYVLYKLTVAL